MNNRRLGADEHSIMGGKIGIMCVSLGGGGGGGLIGMSTHNNCLAAPSSSLCGHRGI